ncbi:MAG: hypothetical protein JWP35_398 [Caulobacter sp.]|nr:hypothetical protein [Caulobacter sp.]
MTSFLKLLRRATAALIALTLSWSLAAAAWAAPALWVMTDKDSTIYLFGTMHVLEPDQKWRTPLFDAAYGRATTVWFETDMDIDPVAMQGLILKYGIDPKRTLSEKLDPATIARVKAALQGTTVTFDAIEHMRPWAVGLMLTVMPMLKQGYTPEAGADATLTTAAKGTTKQIRTFETIEQQVRIFADMSEAGEISFLEETLDDGADSAANVNLEASWAGGDLVAVGSLMVNDMRVDSPELYDAMIRRRNLAWAEVLDGQMQGKGVTMVNIGALHLIGPDGIPQLMRARGYKVERIQ